MKRPTTIAGLLWRLAGLYPLRLVVLALGVAAIVGVFATGRTSRRAAVEGCPFEQTWFDGDVHFSQELAFDHDGKGTWTTGGSASDAPHLRMDFRWHRDDSTLTAVSGGGETRTVGYEITRRNGTCSLGFDDVFLPDDGQSRHYSDRR